MRVVVGPNKPVYDKLKHDDVVIVPEFFCKEDDWSLYYKLVEEMRIEVQQAEHNPDNKGSEWISWHEGAHLISKNPKVVPPTMLFKRKFLHILALRMIRWARVLIGTGTAPTGNPFTRQRGFQPPTGEESEHHRRGLFRGHTRAILFTCENG